MGKKLILFVHGLGGHYKNTWKKFPDFIRTDPKFNDFEVAYYSYPTSIFRLPFSKKYPGVNTLSNGLSTVIRNRHKDHKEIVLVAHSLGGLVCKQLVSDNDLLTGQEVIKVLFYAVPNLGSNLAQIGKLVSFRHSQLKDLCNDSKTLETIGENWLNVAADRRPQVKYVVGGQDSVVTEASARGENHQDIIEVLPDEGHLSIVKPRSPESMPFVIFKNFVLPDEITDKPVQSYADFCASLGLTNCFSSEPGPFHEPRIQSHVRVSMAAIMKVEANGKYLLIQNARRPESYSPIGGVFKYDPSSVEDLDKLGFVGEVHDNSMAYDLRGHMPFENCKKFLTWFLAGQGRESNEQCLNRELQEEFREIGLLLDISQLSLKYVNIRNVVEEPEYDEGIHKNQLRLQQVFDIAGLDVDQLFVQARSLGCEQKLLMASKEEVIRGRSESGAIIGGHTAYLFDKKRYRSNDPIFVPKK